MLRANWSVRSADTKPSRKPAARACSVSAKAADVCTASCAQFPEVGPYSIPSVHTPHATAVSLPPAHASQHVGAYTGPVAEHRSSAPSGPTKTQAHKFVPLLCAAASGAAAAAASTASSAIRVIIVFFSAVERRAVQRWDSFAKSRALSGLT